MDVTWPTQQPPQSPPARSTIQAVPPSGAAPPRARRRHVSLTAPVLPACPTGRPATPLGPQKPPLHHMCPQHAAAGVHRKQQGPAHPQSHAHPQPHARPPSPTPTGEMRV
ncbi:swi5-dependent recombination DNA repair protein 1 homolog [Eriocheir sinensis]|uniref:swi5-dependent recombination DNA repair protein 1 homolog n=1 Tax=Eriocheir sinensis TaxID=95602 RepID=UPI0021C70BE2|nr:swi5-dependent recombination DNA repair protein 1 homolog [Eriocheir sinensis]